MKRRQDNWAARVKREKMRNLIDTATEHVGFNIVHEYSMCMLDTNNVKFISELPRKAYAEYSEFLADLKTATQEEITDLNAIFA